MARARRGRPRKCLAMRQPFSSQITRQKPRCDPRDGGCARTAKSVGRALVLRKPSRALQAPPLRTCCARFTEGCGGVRRFSTSTGSASTRWLVSVTLPWRGNLHRAPVRGRGDRQGNRVGTDRRRRRQERVRAGSRSLAGRDQGRNQDRRPHARGACDRCRRIDRLGEVRHEGPHWRRRGRRDIGVRARERTCAVGARGERAAAPAAGAPSAPAPVHGIGADRRRGGGGRRRRRVGRSQRQ